MMKIILVIWNGKQRERKRELASERKRQSILRSEVKWVMRGARARSTKQKARLERFEQLKAMDSPKDSKAGRDGICWNQTWKEND